MEKVNTSCNLLISPFASGIYLTPLWTKGHEEVMVKTKKNVKPTRSTDGGGNETILKANECAIKPISLICPLSHTMSDDSIMCTHWIPKLVFQK